MRFSLFFIATTLFAQFGASTSPGQTPRANPLPLSGRSAGGGSVAATESPVPGTTTSVNTINPQIQVQGAYAGSAEGQKPFTGKLSLTDAVNRALAYNLGSISLSQAVRQSHGELRIARSALLPNVNGSLAETVEQVNLAAAGIRFHIPIPGLSIPSVVGPFNYFDLRATLTQTVANMTEWNNRKSAEEAYRANQLSARDARDLVVLAAGGAYLQVIAAGARLQSAQAQLETAKALYNQASQQHNVGLVAQIDVNRSRIQMLTEQQRLASLENDFAKQKINLARITGLPPNDHYDLADDVPFAPASTPNLDDALKQAFTQRSDLKSAEAQVRAAERARAAARDERLPSLSLSANYGAIGQNPSNAHGTFGLTGSLNFPIWQGGHIAGDIEQADAALAQRQAELEDLRGRVESDVRNAYLDLDAARTQVDVSQQNLQVARQNLDLTRQRYDAGVADNVEVVQSQQSVASAELDYVNSVFAHNVAKLSLARAMGQAADKWMQSLEVKAK